MEGAAMGILSGAAGVVAVYVYVCLERAAHWGGRRWMSIRAKRIADRWARAIVPPQRASR